MSEPQSCGLCECCAAWRTVCEQAEQQLELLRPGGRYAWKERAERAERERDEVKAHRDKLLSVVGADDRTIVALTKERDEALAVAVKLLARLDAILGEKK